MARMERVNRRTWIICIILIISLILTNAGWIVYESQFQYTEHVEQEVDTGQGEATVIGIGNYNDKN